MGFKVLGLEFKVSWNLIWPHSSIKTSEASGTVVSVYLEPTFGGFPKLGVPFWGGPFIKDDSILGSMLGSPSFGKLPYIHDRDYATKSAGPRFLMPFVEIGVAKSES